MFKDLRFEKQTPAYIQLKDYIRMMIIKGMIRKGEKLPCTRELSEMLNVSRNTIISAYEYLEDEGFIHNINRKGAFVSEIEIKETEKWNVDWESFVNHYGKKAEELDIIKHEAVWQKHMISFKSIAPDESLFEVEQLKKAFLNRISIEGEKLLNYGYAIGYKPLVSYIEKYMESKGISLYGKKILITNGFTEAFDLVLSSLTKPGDKIICENPTHNTAIKIMKLHNLNIVGVNMNEDGIDMENLREAICEKGIKLGYLVPSYHNPTGTVMSADKRLDVYNIFKQHNVPIIEDGFNEELRYSGAHLSPLCALGGDSNSVIYAGSFSKVLFPGIRIGWVLGDEKLVNYLESVKRSRNIHTSFLDQGILYDYLIRGSFEKYMKKIRKVYREKYEFAYICAKQYIPYDKIYGEGGMHIFIKLKGISSRELLKKCIEKGVIFTPGDIFYTDKGGEDTLRLGFSRVSFEDIEKGFRIIGETIEKMTCIFLIDN